MTASISLTVRVNDDDDLNLQVIGSEVVSFLNTSFINYHGLPLVNFCQFLFVPISHCELDTLFMGVNSSFL